MLRRKLHALFTFSNILPARRPARRPARQLPREQHRARVHERNKLAVCSATPSNQELHIQEKCAFSVIIQALPCRSLLPVFVSGDFVGQEELSRVACELLKRTFWTHTRYFILYRPPARQPPRCIRGSTFLAPFTTFLFLFPFKQSARHLR